MTTKLFNSADNFSDIAGTGLLTDALVLNQADLTTGATVTASGNYAGQPPENMIDDDTGTVFASEDGSPPHWFKIDFGAGNAYALYRYRLYVGTNHFMVNWTLEGSNDDTNWDTLDTRASESLTGESWNEFTFANTTAYRFYRWTVTSTNSGWVQVRELELFVGSGEALIHDSGATSIDFDSGMSADFSTATNSTTLTAKYQYAAYDTDQGWTTTNEVNSNAAWNGSWLTLVQLQVVVDTDKRFLYLKTQVTGETAQSFVSFSIDDYSLDTTPPAVPSATKFSLFESDNYALIWVDPADSDFLYCELKRIIDGTTEYLIKNDSGLPAWATEGDVFKFAKDDTTADFPLSNFIDRDVVGTEIAHYVRSVDINNNASSWQGFTQAEDSGTLAFSTVYWEEDENGDLMPRETPLLLNYPIEGVVADGITYGHSDQYTGTLNVSGAVIPPDGTFGLPVEVAIRKLLLDNVLLNAAIDGRIYPNLAPQNSDEPLIIYQRVATDHGTHLLNADGMVKARIQIDFYSQSYDEVKTIAEYTRYSLHGYRGKVTKGGLDCSISSCVLTSDIDGFDNPPAGSERGTYRVIHDYEIVYSESVNE